MEQQAEQRRWDQAARDYQNVFLLGLNDYNRSLLCFWQEKGMLRPGCRVLDVGCGVGKYGTYLAELGCSVTLTDISEEMLRYAARNMEKYDVPWMVYACDFREATGREPAFAEGFDLAISTMSPAVSDAATVRKMSAMTRGWCFLARFYDWQQPFRELLMDGMDQRVSHFPVDLKKDCDGVVRAVREAGYEPQVRIVDYNWADERTPEEMAGYLCRHCFAEGADTAPRYEKLVERASTYTKEDETVTDAVNTKVMWIFWPTA